MEKDFRILVNVIETMSKCCSVKVLLCHSVTVSKCHRVKVSQCQSVTVSNCHCVIVLQCQSVAVSKCYCVIVSHCHSIKVSLCRSFALSLHWKVYHAVRYVPIYGYLCNIYSTQFAHHEDVCSFNINDINL